MPGRKILKDSLKENFLKQSLEEFPEVSLVNFLKTKSMKDFKKDFLENAEGFWKDLWN